MATVTLSIKCLASFSLFPLYFDVLCPVCWRSVERPTSAFELKPMWKKKQIMVQGKKSLTLFHHHLPFSHLWRWLPPDKSNFICLLRFWRLNTLHRHLFNASNTLEIYWFIPTLCIVLWVSITRCVNFNLFARNSGDWLIFIDTFLTLQTCWRFASSFQLYTKLGESTFIYFPQVSVT